VPAAINCVGADRFGYWSTGQFALGRGLVSRGRSPVGHFRSEPGERAYLAAYREAMTLLPTPGSTLDLETTFGRVRVYEFGAASADRAAIPAVLLPGRTSGVPMWAYNLPDLAAARITYALDALGDAGLSVQVRPIRDAAEQADWLDQVLAQLPVRSVHLVGHSFGGWLAATYAVRHPERVRTLTLLDPVFVLQGLRWQVYLISLPASLPFLPCSWRTRMLSTIGGGAVDLADPVARMISEATEHYVVKLPPPKRFTDTQLRGLHMPVYAALAARSIMHHGAHAADVARAEIPDPTVELWPDATHSLPMEQTAQLDHRMLAFMATHEG
jgi:pimeloyl-ACP methyl ester carboxylesterase